MDGKYLYPNKESTVIVSDASSKKCSAQADLPGSLNGVLRPWMVGMSYCNTPDDDCGAIFPGVYPSDNYVHCVAYRMSSPTSSLHGFGWIDCCRFSITFSSFNIRACRVSVCTSRREGGSRRAGSTRRGRTSRFGGSQGSER